MTSKDLKSIIGNSARPDYSTEQELRLLLKKQEQLISKRMLEVAFSETETQKELNTLTTLIIEKIKELGDK